MKKFLVLSFLVFAFLTLWPPGVSASDSNPSYTDQINPAPPVPLQSIADEALGHQVIAYVEPVAMASQLTLYDEHEAVSVLTEQPEHLAMQSVALILQNRPRDGLSCTFNKVLYTAEWQSAQSGKQTKAKTSNPTRLDIGE